MERTYQPRSPESKEGAMIQQMATEAANLVRQKKFARLQDAVGFVLDGRRVSSDRSTTFRQVMSELGRRGARARRSQGERRGPTLRSVQAQTQEDLLRIENENLRALEDSLREEMMRDAFAHQARQPRSAWDPDHPENTP